MRGGERKFIFQVKGKFVLPRIEPQTVIKICFKSTYGIMEVSSPKQQITVHWKLTLIYFFFHCIFVWSTHRTTIDIIISDTQPPSSWPRPASAPPSLPSPLWPPFTFTLGDCGLELPAFHLTTQRLLLLPPRQESGCHNRCLFIIYEAGFQFVSCLALKQNK